MTGQAVTLGALVGRLDRLEVRCCRCERHGRLGLAKLVAEHGADLGMPELAVLLAGDCPKAAATNPARSQQTLWGRRQMRAPCR